MMGQNSSAMPVVANETDSRDDLELIAAINGGDAGAFEVLYRRHRDWVVNLAWRFTGDHDLTLDVLQETFLYLLKKFPGFKLTARLQTFLYPAVRNLSIAARRKKARFQSGQSVPETLPDSAAPGASENAREHLACALSALSEEHREVLLLRFVDELSLNEIAAVMDIPLGTVKSRMHHALNILRRDDRIRKFFEQ
jgi:RNA polymerase sigma-70 factor, ECF subfamily